MGVGKVPTVDHVAEDSRVRIVASLTLRGRGREKFEEETEAERVRDNPRSAASHGEAGGSSL